jgi:hypothetical protein
MDAPADYSAAVSLLTRNVPAYVSYTIHAFVHVGVDHQETDRVTVRTSDGKVVKGKRPGVVVNGSGDTKGPTVHDAVFNPKCYVATGARRAQFEGRAAEELTLRSTCHDRGDDDDKSSDAKNQGDFTKFYVDPVSHVPLAVTGGNPDDKTVAVKIDQHFTQASGHVVPSSLHVEVKGSGFMFWLNVVVREDFSDFAFSNKAP